MVGRVGVDRDDEPRGQREPADQREPQTARHRGAVAAEDSHVPVEGVRGTLQLADHR